MNLLTRISQYGVEQNQSPSLRSRIELTNKIAFVIAGCCVIGGLYFILQIDELIPKLAFLAAFIAMGVVLWLNRIGQTLWSRIVLCAFPILAILVTPVVTKVYEVAHRDISHYMSPKILLVGLLIVPLIIFELNNRKERRIIFALGIVAVLGFDPLHMAAGVWIDKASFNPERYPASVVQSVIAFCITFFAYRYLHEKIQKYQNELLNAKHAAEEAAVAKSDFLSRMSHEIRTPLNGVIGMAELLKLTELDEKQKEQIGVLQHSGKNLLSLVNDILDFSKIEAGKLELESIDIELRAFADATFKQFYVPADEKGVVLKLEYDQRNPNIISADSVRLAQILNNLLSNAIKFTRRGSVTLRVETLDLTPGIAKIQFSVKDTGIGMSPEQLEIVFDSFSQATSMTTREFGGTGLGLSISKSLVERFGSELLVESKLGEGTIFHFTLELPYSGAGVKVLTNMEPDEFNLKGIKILMAEDNELNVMVARGFLEHWGADVFVASNGQEAVNMMNAGSFDLILMDVHMPRMNGIDATREIRKFNNEIPIIALTASSLTGESNELTEAGMNSILQKPFKPDDLQGLISEQLN